MVISSDGIMIQEQKPVVNSSSEDAMEIEIISRQKKSAWR